MINPIKHTVISIFTATMAVQLLEVTPDKKIVWALRSGDEPAQLGRKSSPCTYVDEL